MSVAAEATERSEGGTAAAPSPRAVTRGESGGQQRAKVDWLNATFPRPSLSIEGFVGLLSRMLGRPVSAEPKGGLYGFETSVQLMAHVGSRKAPFGFIAYGGEQQLGRWLLQITGAGCGLVTDWAELRALLEDLGAKLTRVDLAVDFHDGEYTVDDAVAMHEAGKFTAGGRTPTTHVAGDWLGRVNGRTLYVGKAVNGKSLRVYEKGRQLGDLTSDWVRYEVQLGSRDRVIPFETLTECDRYFAGAYPALAELLEQSGEAINTVRQEGATTLAHLLFHLKRCYGKALDVVVQGGGVDVAELIEEVRIVGVPRRLKVSSVAAGLSWGELLQHLKRKPR